MRQRPGETPLQPDDLRQTSMVIGAAEMTIAEHWKRSANSAAAVHQIRNRLQSIIIEAALLKRANGAIDPAAFSRIGALAQDGANFLELFGEITPPPNVDGVAEWASLEEFFNAQNVEFEDESAVSIQCEPQAFAAMVNILVCDAIPFRGFRCAKASADRSAAGRIEVRIVLKPSTPAASVSAVSPWLTVQQMVRDLGGSLELQSGDPPLVKIALPAVD